MFWYFELERASARRYFLSHESEKCDQKKIKSNSHWFAWNVRTCSLKSDSDWLINTNYFSTSLHKYYNWESTWRKCNTVEESINEICTAKSISSEVINKPNTPAIVNSWSTSLRMGHWQQLFGHPSPVPSSPAGSKYSPVSCLRVPLSSSLSFPLTIPLGKLSQFPLSTMLLFH